MNQIKKIFLLLITAVMMTATAFARGDDMSKLETMNPQNYFAARAPMLNGLNLYEYGLYQGLTQKLTMLQIATFASNFDRPRDEVRKLTRNMDCGISMQTSYASIKVWGNPNKDGNYERVVIGIGSRGKLTYIYMEGEISAQSLSQLLNIWM